jgi:hypothetical protein
MAQQALSPADVALILGVVDRLGISREAVVIPLRRVHPGTVRPSGKGKIEILVEAEGALADWLPEMERLLVELRPR